MRSYLTLLGLGSPSTVKTPKCLWDVVLTLHCGNRQTGDARAENRMEVPQEAEISTCWFSNLSPGWLDSRTNGSHTLETPASKRWLYLSCQQRQGIYPVPGITWPGKKCVYTLPISINPKCSCHYICNKMNGTGGCCVKLNNPDNKRKMPHGLSEMWVILENRC